MAKFSYDSLFPDISYTPRPAGFSKQDLIRLGLIPDDTKPEDKGVEEWVWVDGYKGTDKDMKCRGYQFELGKQFDMPEGEEIILCHSGFHLCQELNNVFPFYPIGDGNRYFKVRALVRRYNKNGTYTYEHRDDKMTSKSITFVRELTADEIFEARGFNDPDIKAWTTEQKELALKTSVNNVLDQTKIKNLVELGYSETFATWAVNRNAYNTAHMLGLTPDVSMDVKVLTVAMEVYD